MDWVADFTGIRTRTGLQSCCLVTMSYGGLNEKNEYHYFLIVCNDL